MNNSRNNKLNAIESREERRSASNKIFEYRVKIASENGGNCSGQFSFSMSVKLSGMLLGLVVNLAGCYQLRSRRDLVSTSYFPLERSYILLAKLRHTWALQSKNPPGTESATAVSSHSIRLQYHSRGSSTISLPCWSVSISRPLRAQLWRLYRPRRATPSRFSSVEHSDSSILGHQRPANWHITLSHLHR